MMEEMLQAVKLALPVKSAAFDAELNDLIEMAAADLSAAGIEQAHDFTRPRTRQAVKLYCKGYFGTGNAEFREAYTALKLAMANGSLDGEVSP